MNWLSPLSKEIGPLFIPCSAKKAIGDWLCMDMCLSFFQARRRKSEFPLTCSQVTEVFTFLTKLSLPFFCPWRHGHCHCPAPAMRLTPHSGCIWLLWTITIYLSASEITETTVATYATPTWLLWFTQMVTPYRSSLIMTSVAPKPRGGGIIKSISRKIWGTRKKCAARCGHVLLCGLHYLQTWESRLYLGWVRHSFSEKQPSFNVVALQPPRQDLKLDSNRIFLF